MPLWENLVVTSTLPRESTTGGIRIPVKFILQNGKTQNEVAPSSSALAIKTLEPPNRKGQLHIKCNETIILLFFFLILELSSLMILSEACDRCSIGLYAVNSPASIKPVLGTAQCVGFGVDESILITSKMTSTVVPSWERAIKKIILLKGNFTSTRKQQKE